MDGLPVDRRTTFPERSANPGKMHACGHDVHMACLLGAAESCRRYRGNFRKGPVCLPACRGDFGRCAAHARGGAARRSLSLMVLLHFCDPFLPAERWECTAAHSEQLQICSTASLRGGDPRRRTHSRDDVIAIACRVISALHEACGEDGAAVRTPRCSRWARSMPEAHGTSSRIGRRSRGSCGHWMNRRAYR